MKTRAELKEMAKEQLGHNIFGEKWLLAVILVLLFSVIFSVSGFLVILIFIIGGALTVGFTRCWLDVSRGIKDKVDFSTIGVGFSDLGGTFLLAFMQGLFVFLWSLLLIVPGIIKSYAYSMAFYIYCDEPGKDYSYYLKKSSEMMKGHKWQLFVLQLSFLGWNIVGALCLGVGTLWVAAYENMTITNFYNEIKRLNEGAVTPVTAEVKPETTVEGTVETPTDTEAK